MRGGGAAYDGGRFVAHTIAVHDTMRVALCCCLQVCEIGFNCGHSAVLWLVFGSRSGRDGDAESSSHLLSFDVFDQKYAPSWCVSRAAAGALLRSTSSLALPLRSSAPCAAPCSMQHVQSLHDFRRRIEFVAGDSTRTVAAASAERPAVLCDVFMVDGLHTGVCTWLLARRARRHVQHVCVAHWFGALAAHTRRSPPWRPAGSRAGRNPLVDLQNALSFVLPGATVVMDDAGCSSWWCADVTDAVTWGHDHVMFQGLRCPEYRDTKGSTGHFAAETGSRGWCEAQVAVQCEVCASQLHRNPATCRCEGPLRGAPSGRLRQAPARRELAPPAR